MKKHLITGVTGQDGLFLVQKINKYEPESEILGISRNISTNLFYENLKSIGLTDTSKIKILNTNLENKLSVKNLINDFNPDAIYNLSGPSSPSESLREPQKYKKINLIFSNLTDVLIEKQNFVKFFQASSSEMFKTSRYALSENSDFQANSPYSKAKLINHNKVLELNKNYNWNIFSGIMFNHESEFRKKEYLFKKIVETSKKIKAGEVSNIKLGSVDYVRDWSFAGDISEAIYKITNHGLSSSYVIGSGIGHSIKDLLETVFRFYNLDIDKHLIIDENFLRKGDPKSIIANPSKIASELNWECKLSFNDLVMRCIKAWA